ncbi:MAG: ABC transporter ATP-binding protein [Clostridia bacterium]|nr:ABC transporter ATP-binding protein [Clostridia bacterium]
MIECKNLSVKGILRDISFKANAAEITVIIGKNGSGKTTLLRCLSNAVGYKGEVFINNKEVKCYGKNELSRLIALMPQSLPLPDVSLRRLVGFGRAPYTGFSGRLSLEDNKIIDSAIQAVGLGNIADRSITLLSGGERRLAYFAMLLCQSTPVIICDEPTANLDTEHQKAILSLLCKQRELGKTVICVLHDINQTVEIADRILLIDSGTLSFYGTELYDLPVSHFGLTEYDCNGKKLYL